MKKIGALIKVFGYIDYLVSAGLLAYGMYTSSALFVAGGLLGLVLAYLKPAERLKNHLEKKFIRKKQPVHHEAMDEFFGPAGLVASTPSANYVPRSRYSGTRYFNGLGNRRFAVANPRDLISQLTGSDTSAARFGVKPARRGES